MSSETMWLCGRYLVKPIPVPLSSSRPFWVAAVQGLSEAASSSKSKLGHCAQPGRVMLAPRFAPVFGPFEFVTFERPIAPAALMKLVMF